MRKIMSLILLILTLGLFTHVSFVKGEDEDYVYVEIKDPVTGKTEIKKMKNVFTEKTPKSRSEQIMEETLRGATEGAATGVAGSLITSGGANMPVAVGVGTTLGAAKGAYKGATEPTEYNTFGKTKINQNLRNSWTQEGPQPDQPGYLSEEEKRQAYERAKQQDQE